MSAPIPPPIIKEGVLYVDPQLDPTAPSTPIPVDVDPKMIYGGIGRRKGKIKQEVEGLEVEQEVEWKVTKNKGPFLIVGFDTEYVRSPSNPNRNRVLSYQFFAILPKGDGSIEKSWGGVAYVKEDERITRSTFFGWVYREGLKHVNKLPKYAVLVGHYTKADVTAFHDFETMKGGLMAIRNSFISNDHERSFNRVELPRGGNKKRKKDDGVIFAPLRDTWLLCPSLERSLEKVGNLLDPVRYGKIQIPSQFSKSRMDQYLAADRPGFEAYALRDAEICAHYALRIVLLNIKAGLPANVSATLTGIGVALLVDFLKKGRSENYFEECFGLEAKEDGVYRSGKDANGKQVKSSRSWTTTKTVENNYRYWHRDFASECYHGGRNEQYFFGPAPVDNWQDYDLSGAYPTAMAMIGRPMWVGLKERQESDYWKTVKPTDLGYFYVHFQFPDSVRFPIFTVRTQHGLLFPRTGSAYCCAPEIVAARNLGCKITVARAIELPVLPNQSFL